MRKGERIMDIQLMLTSDEKKNLKIVKVRLDQLPPNDELDSPAPTSDFVQDILARGQLEPIHLNKTEKGYFVISGRRRIKTFRELQKVDEEQYSTINAIVHEAGTNAAIYAASAHNNRKADNPIVDLQAIETFLKEKPSASKQQISQATGIPIPRIAKRLKLLNLVPAIQQAVKDGNVTCKTAEKASGLPTNMQNALVEKMNSNKGRLSEDDVTELQRVRVQDTAKKLVLPSIKPISPMQEKVIFGYILVDPEFNNILGGLLKTMAEVENHLAQYKKDYPEIKLELMKVIK